MATTTAPAAPVRRRPVARASRGRKLALLLVLAVLWVLLSASTDTFLTSSNLSNLSTPSHRSPSSASG
jgi:ABC-type xylose transport system permease subunit